MILSKQSGQSVYMLTKTNKNPIKNISKDITQTLQLKLFMLIFHH